MTPTNDNTPASRKYLTIKEVGAVYGLSPSTIYRMRRSGNFPPPVQVSPGKIGFIPHEVADWWNGLHRAA